MGTSSLSWANLPLHGHIFSLICSHHSSPANLSMRQQTESEAKANAKAKPNMMIICSCKPCLAHAMPRRLSNHLLRLSSPLQLKVWTASVPYKITWRNDGAYALQISEKSIWLPQLLAEWPWQLTTYITILYYIAT